MKPLSTKASSLALDELRGNRDAARSDAGQATLTRALASRQASLVIAAAQLVAEYTITPLRDALATAFHALAGDKAASQDPGALAKEALVAALDAIDADEASLFAAAALFSTREAPRGTVRDSSGRLRARGLLALARVTHPDFSIIAAAGLTDPDATVQLSAARALATRGLREGAGLLLLRMRSAEIATDLYVACLHGLFVLAPEFAVTTARQGLRDAREASRERVLHALGSAHDARAADLLAGELSSAALSDDRLPFIHALGLSVHPRAREHLLELVSGERESDAEAALEALAIHRYDPRLRAELELRTAHDDDLARRLRALF